MKNLFNYLSLAKPLGKDIITSPWRVQKDMKSSWDGLLRWSEGYKPWPIKRAWDYGINHSAAAFLQLCLMIISAGIAEDAAIAAGGGRLATTFSAAAGIALGTPLAAKIVMKFLQIAGETIHEPEKLSDQKYPFPKFEAYPELNKALTQPEPEG